jgi:peroxiredoxin
MAIAALHTVVPDLSLPDLAGRRISLWDFKHRQPVVLVFCSEDDAGLLRDFARHYQSYRDEGAEVLAILSRHPRQETWPFPVLIDKDRRMTSRYVERTPAVLVLDSFNELNARFEGPWEEGPDHRRILGVIAEVELKCPECGVPEWPQ